MLSERQLKLRRSGVGSSEIGALCEVDEHRGPVDVWAEKIGLARAPTEEQRTRFATGHALEAAIGALYAERFGCRLRSGGGTVRHANCRIALATLDRRSNGPAPIVEIKNVGRWQAPGWADGLPASKYLQVQWQLEVADEELAHVAALLGGTEFQVFPVQRDHELGAWLLEVARDFWPYVERREPPPCDDARQQLRGLGLRYPTSDGALLPATDEALGLATELRAAQAAQGELKRHRAKLEARAKELIGGADGIEACFTWRVAGGGDDDEEGGGRVAWAKVAADAGATPEMIARHTSAPSRTFRITKEKRTR